MVEQVPVTVRGLDAIDRRPAARHEAHVQCLATGACDALAFVGIGQQTVNHTPYQNGTLVPHRGAACVKRRLVGAVDCGPEFGGPEMHDTHVLYSLVQEA